MNRNIATGITDVATKEVETTGEVVMTGADVAETETAVVAAIEADVEKEIVEEEVDTNFQDSFSIWGKRTVLVNAPLSI